MPHHPTSPPSKLQKRVKHLDFYSLTVVLVERGLQLLKLVEEMGTNRSRKGEKGGLGRVLRRRGLRRRGERVGGGRGGILLG